MLKLRINLKFFPKNRQKFLCTSPHEVDNESDNKNNEKVKRLCKFYELAKKLQKKLPLVPHIEKTGIFACSELNLKQIKVYGFSMDETLLNYKKSYMELFFDTAKNILVDELHYPTEINKLKYDEFFSISGLHFDVKEGFLLKLDANAEVNLSTVYRGKNRLTPKQILKVYHHIKLQTSNIEDYEGTRFLPVADWRKSPEVDLISSVIQFFDVHGMNINTKNLYTDFQVALKQGNNICRQKLVADIQNYVNYDENIKRLFKKLKDHAKKIFIVTNNSDEVFHSGMEFLLGSDYMDYFDLVIVRAKKPDFFTKLSIPVRQLSKEDQKREWHRVKKLLKGEIYMAGNIRTVNDITGWFPREVLYFANSLYSDLANASSEHGWRTCAIIKDLDHEIEISNQDCTRELLRWVIVLNELYQHCHHIISTKEEAEILCSWYKEALGNISIMHGSFNKYFGSTFYSDSHPSLYTERLVRCADLYSSKITNLLQYNLNNHFMPHYKLLPHDHFF